jgi:hypothetical protein
LQGVKLQRVGSGLNGKLGSRLDGNQHPIENYSFLQKHVVIS